MDSIKKVSIGEIKTNKEELLNSMKGLVHTAKDIFGSTPFKDECITVGTDHILTIEVGGNTYPVHYTPNTMAMLDGDLSITDYIFDEENYLSLSDDDDMKWFSLVMDLGLKIESKELSIEYLNNELKDKDERINQLSKNNTALSAENKTTSDALKEADRNVRYYAREVDNLEKEIKDLQAKAIAEKVSDPDVSKMEEAYTTRTLELLNKIEELENENEELKKKLFCGVPTKFGEQERLGSKQANEIIEDCEASKEAVNMDLETAMLLQENNKLKEEIQSIKETNHTCIQYIDRTAVLLEENYNHSIIHPHSL